MECWPQIPIFYSVIFNCCPPRQGRRVNTFHCVLQVIDDGHRHYEKIPESLSSPPGIFDSAANGQFQNYFTDITVVRLPAQHSLSDSKLIS